MIEEIKKKIAKLVSNCNRAISKGEELGYSNGYSQGKAEGRTQGLSDGRKAEYDKFWDTFQNYGNSAGANYQYAFAFDRFTDENYNPKYPIICSERTTSGQAIFIESGITDTKVPVSFLGNLMQRFIYNSCVKTVNKLIVNENLTYSTNNFQDAAQLENITFEGVIGQNGLNFQWSPNLTIESMRSIISCLKDYSADTSGTAWIVTVGATNLSKLTDDDLNSIQAKGWEFV